MLLFAVIFILIMMVFAFERFQRAQTRGLSKSGDVIVLEITRRRRERQNEWACTKPALDGALMAIIDAVQRAIGFARYGLIGEVFDDQPVDHVHDAANGLTAIGQCGRPTKDLDLFGINAV